MVALSETPAETLCASFQRQVAGRDSVWALTMSGHPGLTWAQYGEAVRRLTPGLVTLGAEPGRAVALLMGPRPEFHVVDTAILHAGAVPFSLQQGDSPEMLSHHITRADASLLVTEARHLDTSLSLLQDLAVLTHVVVVDGPGDGGRVLGLEEVMTFAGPEFEALWTRVDPKDVATLIFTSGTTGAPKAVQLSHRAIVASEHGTAALAPFHNTDGTVLSYLPLNHIAERFMSHYASLTFGVSVRSVADPDRLYEEIAATRPIRFFGVPRVYEKLVDRARVMLDADPRLRAALDTNREAVRASHAGRALDHDQHRAAVAAHDVLGIVRKELGLDRAEYLGVATAPSSYGMLETLHALGLTVSDLWGMSEAIMCTLNPPDSVRLGTVGRFLPGVEGRIADDGEILVRGPNSFSGYLGDPDRTAEILDVNGWIHTGDVGSIHDGYLTIRGRKKELLITATGKNIAPAAIEGALKDASPLIDHAVAIADGRRWVTALLVLDEAEVTRVGCSDDFATAAGSALVRNALDEAVAAANVRLSRPERIRGYHVVDRPWRPGDPELTPTLKLRRDVIAQAYAAEIDQLYS